MKQSNILNTISHDYGKQKCPKCGGRNTNRIKNRQRWHCNDCCKDQSKKCVFNKFRKNTSEPRNIIVEICPNLLKLWNKDKIFNKEVNITKTGVNLATSKLTIFCNRDHNCFCDERVRKNPGSVLVARGKELR